MENADKFHEIYLGLGTNLGDRPLNIKTAIEKISERIGEVVSKSSFYETEPVGFLSDNFFINAVCHVRTHLNPLQLIDAAQQIEKEMGRLDKSVGQAYSDRIIDIDLLMFDDMVVNYPHLTLPHPFLHTRSFVLFPLADIAPDLYHPILKKTVAQIKDDFKSNALIKKK